MAEGDGIHVTGAEVVVQLDGDRWPLRTPSWREYEKLRAVHAAAVPVIADAARELRAARARASEAGVDAAAADLDAQQQWQATLEASRFDVLATLIAATCDRPLPSKDDLPAWFVAGADHHAVLILRTWVTTPTTGG